MIGKPLRRRAAAAQGRILVTVSASKFATQREPAPAAMPSSGDRTVTLIDRSTARVIGEPIPVGKNARAVAEGLGYLWVSNTDDDTVTRIDPSSREPLGAPIRVGDRPKEIAMAGGFVWVVNEYGNVVSRIDPKSGKLAGAPIAVGKAPHWPSVFASARELLRHLSGGSRSRRCPPASRPNRRRASSECGDPQRAISESPCLRGPQGAP